MKIDLFFGDDTYPFALTDQMIEELERKQGVGIGALYQRCVRMEFSITDLAQIIRLGLVGGGMAPERAAQLTSTYASNRPFEELYPLALDILDARWSGTPTATVHTDPETGFTLHTDLKQERDVA